MSLFSHGSVHISAKTDYAIRALTEIAGVGPHGSLPAHVIAERQSIPLRFLLNILADLRRVGMLASRRGPNGGWWLVQPPETVTVADIVRAVDGPITTTDSARPGQLPSTGTAAALTDLWTSVRTSIRDILEQTTLADLAAATPAPGREVDEAGPDVRANRAC